MMDIRAALDKLAAGPVLPISPEHMFVGPAWVDAAKKAGIIPATVPTPAAWVNLGELLETSA